MKVVEEFLFYGENEELDWVGFCAPITEVREEGNLIYVTNKYGEYSYNPESNEVTTISGFSYEAMSEIANYTLGYKYWKITPAE